MNSLIKSLLAVSVVGLVSMPSFADDRSHVRNQEKQQQRYEKSRNDAQSVKDSRTGKYRNVSDYRQSSRAQSKVARHVYKDNRKGKVQVTKVIHKDVYKRPVERRKDSGREGDLFYKLFMFKLLTAGL